MHLHRGVALQGLEVLAAVLLEKQEQLEGPVWPAGQQASGGLWLAHVACPVLHGKNLYSIDGIEKTNTGTSDIKSS